MRTKGAYANKEDCKDCVSNIDGRCKTLVETNWIIKHCPFVATEERLQRDRELLERRKHGREEDVREDHH